MSKASSADTSSATTDAQFPSTQSTGDAIARALDVRTDGNRDALCGTDRRAARRLATQAEDHQHTEIDTIRVERYGSTVNVRLSGNVCLSYQDIRRAVGDMYDSHNLLSHATGSVTVTISDQ